METSLYSNLGSAVNKTHHSIGSGDVEVRLKDILSIDSEFPIIDLEEHTLVQAYVNELKDLLELTSPQYMIRVIFNIENNLKSIATQFDLHFEIPNLDHCYKKLSPLFLRTMSDAFEVEKTPEVLMGEWLEVFRIAIEEEYYIWQEKIFDLIEKK